ncbi:hypothetical protein JP0044_06920 [Helicobacter pylori]|nr:hypothetical protein JP0044_06920 [Helicobacter pylori]
MALAISVSMAEKSGAFLGGGFQYSNLENQNTTRTPGANNNTPDRHFNVWQQSNSSSPRNAECFQTGY